MSSLSRKYRPGRWSDLSGQTHIVETLTRALAKNLVGQAYLFTGPRGTGKTTVARLLARSLNCSERTDTAEPCGRCPNCVAFSEGRAFDILEIDGASNNSVDDIRELRETVKLPPTLGAKKIYIIDEVHMLSQGAWNALLKTLEEPPRHAVFILATTELHKIPETIASRCQRFDFGRIPTDLIVEKLDRVAKEEGVTVDRDALEMIALSAEGGLRDAESLLAQTIALEDTHITGAEVSRILGVSERRTVFEFTESLGKRRLEDALLALRTLSDSGADFRSFAGALSHFLREILFAKLETSARKTLSGNIPQDEASALERLGALFSLADLARLLELVHSARKEIRHAVVPEIPLEVLALLFLFPENTHVSNTPSPENPSAPASPSIPQTVKPCSSRIEKGVPRETPVRSTETAPTEKLALPEPTRATPSTPDETLRGKTSEMKNESEAPPEGASENPFPSFESVKSRWQEVVAEMKRRRAALALSLMQSVPVRLDGATLTVAVKRPFHKERLEKPEHRLTLEETLATLFHTPVRCSFELEPSIPASSDPLVESALDILGGKVVGE